MLPTLCLLQRNQLKHASPLEFDPNSTVSRLYIVKSLVKKSNIRKTIELAVMMKKLDKHFTGHAPVPFDPESRGERYSIRNFPSELREPSKSYYR